MKMLCLECKQDELQPVALGMGDYLQCSCGYLVTRGKYLERWNSYQEQLNREARLLSAEIYKDLEFIECCPKK